MCLERSREDKEDSVAEAQCAKVLLEDGVTEEMWSDHVSL